MLLEPEKVRVADRISLLSHIQAEINANAYVLPVKDGYLRFTDYADVGEYPQ